jgi:hypothetical protein
MDLDTWMDQTQAVAHLTVDLTADDTIADWLAHRLQTVPAAQWETAHRLGVTPVAAVRRVRAITLAGLC